MNSLNKAFRLIDPPKLLASKLFADVYLIGHNGFVQAHRLVLAAACPLLRQAFKDTDHESEVYMLKMPDYSRIQILDFLDVVYGVHKDKPLSRVQCEMMKMFGSKHLERVRGQKRPYEEDDNMDNDDLFTDDFPSSSDAMVNFTFEKPKMEDFEEPMVVVNPKPVESKRKDNKDCPEMGKTVVRPTFNQDLFQSHLPVPKIREELTEDGGTTYECPFINCKETKRVRDTMVTHILVNHSKMRCSQCHEMVRAKDMPVHVARQHYLKVRGKENAEDNWNLSEGRLMPDGSLQCPVVSCFFACREKERMDRHIKAHSKVICDYCGKVVQREMMKRHMNANHTHRRVKRFECLECGKGGSMEQDIREHVRNSHGIFDGDITTCKWCLRMMGNKASVELHENICVPPPIKTVKFHGRTRGVTADIKVPWGDGPAPTACPMEDCNFTHDNKSRMRSHYVAVHYKKECPHCGVKVGVYHLERHIQINHLKKYNHVCHICSAGFFNEYNLSNHMDEIHIKEVKYLCEDCGAGFFSQQKRNAHVQKHHRNKDRFRCDPCGKKYTTKESLAKHLRLHHNSEGIAEMNKKQGFVVLPNQQPPPVVSDQVQPPLSTNQQQPVVTQSMPIIASEAAVQDGHKIHYTITPLQ